MVKTKNSEENKNQSFNINDYKEDIDKYIKEKIGIESEKEKDEIDKYVKERVEKEASSNSLKYYKKKIRNKNIVIFIEFILILALIGAGAVGIYYFYNEGCLGTIKIEKNNNNSVENNNSNNQTQNKKEEQKNKLSELIDKYSYLLDDINIDTKSEYLTEYYSGNLTNELKEYLAFQLINSNNITSDESSSYFDADLLKNAFKELFGSTIEYTDFKFNGANYKYLKSKDMFISTSLSTTGNKVIKEITNVAEEDNKIVITTTEGYLKDNKLYNVLSNKEITEYKKDEKMSKYTKKLNVVKYTFNNELLESIK